MSEDQSPINIINSTSSTRRGRESIVKRSNYHDSTTGLELTAWI